MYKIEEAPKAGHSRPSRGAGFAGGTEARCNRAHGGPAQPRPGHPAPAPPARRQAAQHIGALTSVKHPFAVGPFLVVAPRFPAREFTHRWVGHHRIHVGHLLPQLPRRPAHRVLHPVVLGYVAPAAASAGRAEQLFQPLVG